MIKHKLLPSIQKTKGRKRKKKRRKHQRKKRRRWHLTTKRSYDQWWIKRSSGLSDLKSRRTKMLIWPNNLEKPQTGEKDLCSPISLICILSTISIQVFSLQGLQYLSLCWPIGTKMDSFKCLFWQLRVVQCLDL